MAKDKKKDRAPEKPAKARGDGATDRHGGRPDRSGAVETAGGDHHAAKAHGRAVLVDTSLPATRPELMDLHAAARARRNAAPLGSSDFRAAVMDLERIEVRIAAIDRAADPPLG